MRFFKSHKFNIVVIFMSISIIGAMIGLLYKFYVPETILPHLNEIEEVTYSKFASQLKDGNIDTVYYTKGAEKMYIVLNTNDICVVKNADHDNLKVSLLESGIIIKQVADFETADAVESKRAGHVVLLSILVLSVYSCLIFKFVVSRKNYEFIKARSKGVALSAGGSVDVSTLEEVDVKDKSKKDKKSKSFDDVAGLSEVKKDVECLVDFLNNKEKYIEAGASLPKGVIFYGPPGTGKTLLAKAIAGEANVSFLYASASDFVEMYVGVGAKRVREIFQKAKKEAPCVIFIDELDTIGARRHAGDNGEDRKTINALLTELDGFNELDNILVIGATNRLEDLDPALVRPGRFTNKYCIPLPRTPKERLEIINLYSQNKKFDETVNFDDLSKELIGFSPAKIEALLNEAAIISVQENSHYINKVHIKKAMYKALLDGHMKEDDVDVEKEETKIVAWHEAGHAVVGHVLGKEITEVTIVPSTSGAGGVTFSTPRDKALHSVEDIDYEVMELYGGRIAELLLYGKDSTKITTGASNDIERATQLIRSSIVKYGMSKEFGMLNLSEAKVNDKVILDSEVKKAKELEERTIKLLEENKDKLEAIANLLLERATIYKSDIHDVFNPIPKIEGNDEED